MAKDFMAQMLDELMGRNRNSAPDDRKDLDWNDETICKHYLVDYCPNELFTNTKADLGMCRLIHDDQLANMYRASPKRGKMGYENEFLRFLKNMVQDVDRRIDRGKNRLEATRLVAANSLGVKYDERINELTDKIEGFVKEAEELGSQGKVEEAQQKLRQSDQLRKDRDSAKATMESTVQQEKQLEVCQTCGAFLIVGDAQQRIDDHLSGKQHVGYARVKQSLKDEEERQAKELEERRKARDADRETSRGKKEKSEKEASDRSRRSPVHDRVKSSPSRDRSRHQRTRSRSGDRDKRRRSRSRSKQRRSHGRVAEYSRRRSRSISGNRHGSSKSSRKDRDRSKDRRRSRSREDKRRRSRSHEKRSPSSGRSSHKRHATESSNGINGAKNTENDQVPSLDSIHLPKNKFIPAMPVDQHVMQ